MVEKIIYYWGEQGVTLLVDIPASVHLGEAMDYASDKLDEIGIDLPQKLGYVDWLFNVGEVQEKQRNES